MSNEDTGSREIVRMPSGARYYLLAFPYAEQDAFEIKIPYENRQENRRERIAMDKIMSVINLHVKSIHEGYLEEIDMLREKIREVES